MSGICEECKKPAKLKCSACKLVAYCTKEHQKQHWKIHKATCKPYEICKLPALGRYLVASRDLSPGDVIINEVPLVYGPRPHMVEEGPVPCPGCCRLIYAENADRCVGCSWPVCHAACDGLRDPDKHGHECLVLGLRDVQALNQLHNFYRQDVLLALRCLMLQKKHEKKWKQLLAFESHMNKRGKNTEIYNEVENRIVQYLTENYLVPLKRLEKQTNQTLLLDISSEIIHKICGIIDVNTLEINQAAELSAIYPTACLMEHNCIPNTFHNFADASDNFKITVKAALPIKKGDHISTMYTHALWGTQARREHLQETKYFSCNCVRCKDPTELETCLSALKCLGTDSIPCGGIQLPVDPCSDSTEWACGNCKVKLADTEVAFIVNKMGEDVDEQLNNPNVKNLEELLEKMSTFLHSCHYHMYSVKHSLIQLYGYQQGYLHNQLSDEILLRKIEMCRELLDTTTKIDPGNARLVLYSAVLHHELYLASFCKIKRKWGKDDLAETIEEAHQSLNAAKLVLANEKSSAGEKLQNLAETSEKEFRRWLNDNKLELKT